MENLNEDPIPMKVFKPSISSKITLYVLIGLAVYFFVGLAWSSGAMMLLFGGITAPFFVFFSLGFYICSRRYLVICDYGLEYVIGSRRIFNRWENLSEIEIRSFDGKSSIEGIRSIKAEIWQEGNYAEKKFVIESNFIPLTPFVRVYRCYNGIWKPQSINLEKLLKTDFGKDLYHYAPHLFETEKAKR